MKLSLLESAPQFVVYASIDLKDAIIRIKDGYAGPGGNPGAINKTIANPSVTPTVDPDGGGATGGLLTDGDYNVSYTFVTTTGETLRSTSSITFTVAAGEIPAVTLPALPSGVTSMNVYLSNVDGNEASQRKYNTTAVTATTYNLAVLHDYAGSAIPPVANTAGGYAAGITTIIVDDFTGAVADGDQFTVAGETGLPTHTVSSSTGSPTTQIVFTPALASAVADNAVVTVLAHSLEVKIGEGNLTYDEKRNIVYTKNRGQLDDVREGDEEPMDVRLDFLWEHLTASTGDPPTIEDAIKQRGEAAEWVSSDTDDVCKPYSVDIEVTHVVPCVDEENEVILLKHFRWESLPHDLRGASIAMTGKCNVTQAIVTRV